MLYGTVILKDGMVSLSIIIVSLANISLVLAMCQALLRNFFLLASLDYRFAHGLVFRSREEEVSLWKKAVKWSVSGMSWNM